MTMTGDDDDDDDDANPPAAHFCPAPLSPVWLRAGLGRGAGEGRGRLIAVLGGVQRSVTAAAPMID